MRTHDEDTHTAEYWDEYVAEFGVAAYFKARYQDVQIMPTTERTWHRTGNDELLPGHSLGDACDMAEDYTSDDLDRIVVEKDRGAYRERA